MTGFRPRLVLFLCVFTVLSCCLLSFAVPVLIRPSPAFPTKDEVTANLQAVFEPVRDVIVSDAPGGEGTFHAMYMFDKIAVEKRLRYDQSTNKILGLCRDCNEEGYGSIFSGLCRWK